MYLDQEKRKMTYHGSYDSLTIFREIDLENKGWVNADDFRRYFSDNIYDDFNF